MISCFGDEALSCYRTEWASRSSGFKYSSQTLIGFRGSFVLEDLPQTFTSWHWKVWRSLLMMASFGRHYSYAFWSWTYTSGYMNSDQFSSIVPFLAINKHCCQPWYTSLPIWSSLCTRTSENSYFFSASLAGFILKELPLHGFFFFLIHHEKCSLSSDSALTFSHCFHFL